MAQLVARLVRNEKVGGSNPPSSTTGRHPIRMSVFCVPGRVGVVLCCRWCSGRRTCCPLGRAAGCARGRRPARSPSAPRASLGASSRSPARPRHRPRAPQPGPAATHGHRGRALRSLRCPPHQWRSRNSRLSLLLAAPLVFQVPSGPAAREARASLRSAPRLEARPGPAAAHRHRGWQLT